MIRPTTKQQKTRALKREENEQRLIELGWSTILWGTRWVQGKSIHTYSFDGAVELEKLRGNIKSNSSLATRKQGGNDNGCPRTEKGKWGKKV